ncbi:hypothetical protein ZTR_09825 [Talaromyces verruculosus]|nr:hypothetical protein ZTR_09825 [Talaromyces verruculosus]
MDSNNLPDIVRQLSKTELQQLLIYILNRLPFPLTNDSIQFTLRGLLARASDKELSKILPNAPSSISKTNAKPSTTSKQPKDIRIKSAVSILRNVTAIDTFDKYEDPGSFWVREVTILDNFSPTDEPIVRYERLRKARSKAKEEGIIVEQLLFLLQIHERDNVLELYKARNSEATTFGGRKESNAYLADTHDLDTDQVRKLVKGWNKLISLMQRHGPGIALRLGGGTSTWMNMTSKECTAMEIYLKRYRPEFLQQSRTLDLKAAGFLRSGLSRAGMVDDVDGLRRTKLGSIILQYTEMEDDRQNTRVDEDTEDEEAVEEDAQHDEAVDEDREYSEAVSKIFSILQSKQSSCEAQFSSTVEQPDGECSILQANTPGQNESTRTHKRSHENSQNAPGSKRRRVGVCRTGTGAAGTTCDANKDGEDEEEDDSSFNPPQSSRESISADDRSARASIIPEVITHDRDTARTEYVTALSPSRSQQPVSSLSILEPRGRNRLRQTEPVCAQSCTQIDNIDDELFCDVGGYDDTVKASLSNSSEATHRVDDGTTHVAQILAHMSDDCNSALQTITSESVAYTNDEFSNADSHTTDSSKALCDQRPMSIVSETPVETTRSSMNTGHAQPLHSLSQGDTYMPLVAAGCATEIGVSSDDLLEANTDTVNDITQQSTSVQTHLGAFENDQECHPDYNTHFKFDTFNFLDHDYTQFNLDTFNFLDHDYTQFNLDTFNFQDDESTQMQTPIASYL